MKTTTLLLPVFLGSLPFCLGKGDPNNAPESPYPKDPIGDVLGGVGSFIGQMLGGLMGTRGLGQNDELEGDAWVFVQGDHAVRFVSFRDLKETHRGVDEVPQEVTLYMTQLSCQKWEELLDNVEEYPKAWQIHVHQLRDDTPKAAEHIRHLEGCANVTEPTSPAGREQVSFCLAEWMVMTGVWDIWDRENPRAEHRTEHLEIIIDERNCGYCLDDWPSAISLCGVKFKDEDGE